MASSAEGCEACPPGVCNKCQTFALLPAADGSQAPRQGPVTDHEQPKMQLCSLKGRAAAELCWR